MPIDPIGKCSARNIMHRVLYVYFRANRWRWFNIANFENVPIFARNEEFPAKEDKHASTAVKCGSDHLIMGGRAAPTPG